MRSLWHIWQSAISNDLCDELVSLPKTPLNDGQVGISDDKIGLKTKIRRSQISVFPYNSEEANLINALLSPFVMMANRENFGFSLNNFQEFQYTEYNSEEQGFYDWHQDVQWLKDRESQRKISITVQLSDDDYEGGNFEFHKDLAQPSNIRSRGTVIVFPSFFYHRVTPVTKGVRKALVGWYEGNCFT